MPKLIGPRRREGAALVLEVVQTHAPGLIRLARQYSLCLDDAEDAFQRGVELLLEHVDEVDPGRAPSWLRSVVKHEALAIREARERALCEDELDADKHVSPVLKTADERVASFDRLSASAEALQRLKPHEVQALLLKAQGHSYREICDLTGWTYTKVNRCLTEGRRTFLDRYATIEAGEECTRWQPVLSALADGEATPAQLQAARPHLRNCPACRATLASFRRSPAQVAALLPAPLALTALQRDEDGVLTRVAENVVGVVGDRVALAVQKAQLMVEGASATKVAAVTASAAAIAGGGVAAQQTIDRTDQADRRDRQAEVRRAVDQRTDEAARPGDGASAQRAGEPSPADAGRQRADAPSAGESAAASAAEDAAPQPATARASSPAPAPARQASREFSFESPRPAAPAPQAATEWPPPPPPPAAAEFTGSGGGGEWSSGNSGSSGGGEAWSSGGSTSAGAGGGGSARTGEFGP